MTKDCDAPMPKYINPRSVTVDTRDPLSAVVISIALAALGVSAFAALVAFMVAHIVVIMLGVVGIAAVVTAETVYLYRRYTVVYMHPGAQQIIDAGLRAQQARRGLGHAAIEAPTPIPVPATRPAIEGRLAPLLNLNLTLNLFGRGRDRQAIASRTTVPGVVIRDDEVTQAVTDDRTRRAIRSAAEEGHRAS